MTNLNTTKQSIKNLGTKVSSAVAGAVILLIGGLMAGLGLTVLGVLAAFGLAAFCLAVLVSPLLPVAAQKVQDAQDDAMQASPSAA